MQIKTLFFFFFFWGGGGGLALKTCSKDISKHFIASSFKLGQLIEDVE